MKILKTFLSTIAATAICVYVGWIVYQDSLAHVEPKRDKKKNEVAVSVEVTRIQKRSIEDRIELVGSLEPVSQVEVRSRISGYIKSLPFDIGDRIEVGDVVVELDDSRNQELVTKATATLRVAEAQLKTARSKQSLAEKQLVRLVELNKTGVATEQETEQAESQVDIAKTEVELEQARVAESASTLDHAKIALKETKLVATSSGVVSQRWVEAGDLAKPDVPLLAIVDLNKVRTTVHVVEKDYPKVKLDQIASVQTDAYPNKRFTGAVIRKAPVLDAATRTATIFIEIDNPQFLLKPGMYARVNIVFKKRSEADVVPIAALIERDQKSALFVVSGDPPVSNLQEVQTGIIDGESVEILSGIDANDRIVTLGSRVISSGQEVRPVEIDYWLDAPGKKETPRSSAAAD
ncbi:MAG: hypothetical protein CMJ78_12100 [Planctomycetaceae bacterium]|nr:hypothetical protein [Planctomycetaceae bacterium]